MQVSHRTFSSSRTQHICCCTPISHTLCCRHSRKNINWQNVFGKVVHSTTKNMLECATGGRIPGQRRLPPRPFVFLKVQILLPSTTLMRTNSSDKWSGTFSPPSWIWDNDYEPRFRRPSCCKDLRYTTHDNFICRTWETVNTWQQTWQHAENSKAKWLLMSTGFIAMPPFLAIFTQSQEYALEYLCCPGRSKGLCCLDVEAVGCSNYKSRMRLQTHWAFRTHWNINFWIWWRWMSRRMLNRLEHTTISSLENQLICTHSASIMSAVDIQKQRTCLLSLCRDIAGALIVTKSQ